VAFSAVLDANILYPFSLRDTLLRLAELELYTPLWSVWGKETRFGREGGAADGRSGSDCASC
jgi:hypothetical protein